MSSVYCIATMDTKGHEIDFVADALRRAGVKVVTVDVGTAGPPAVVPDIDRATVLACHPRGSVGNLHQLDRNAAVTLIGEALVAMLQQDHSAGKIAGVIGVGGSGGSAIIAPAMRALPIGLPKLLVSTLASGNTAPYVGSCDITMMYPVVDVAGLNTVSREVLANAAHAVAGMVTHRRATAAQSQPALGMTMFGVTTPCVTAVRESLEAAGFDCLVFHATGVGGQAMEKLVDSGLLKGVLDLTTTEVADEVVGGILRAGPDRFEAVIRTKVPCVLSVGAMDMVNFGSLESVPAEFRGRKLHSHNAQVTLMRTTADENRRCARWMADKLARATGPLEILLPERGVSALDVAGQPFFDPDADEALFAELERLLPSTRSRTIRRLPLHINDAEFAREAVETFQRIWVSK